MRLGTQDKDFFPSDIMGKFKAVKELGFEVFEIDGKLLVENVEAVKEAIKETGIQVSSACGGYAGWIGDFIEEKRLNGLEDIKKIIIALEEVGGKGIVVPAAWGMFTFRLPPMTSPRSLEGDKKAIMDSLVVLDKFAGEHGVSIYLEPLNRYQDHMLNTIEDARKIIEEGNFKNVTIAADFYHMNIEENDISTSLEVNYEHIGHIHLADNHRYQPGTGCIDFARHFATLKKLGYEGNMIYECRLIGDNHLEGYRKSVEHLKSLI